AGVESVAGCQVVPLSVETSTPATTPPPLSVALPEIVVAVPSGIVAPGAGEAIVEVGAVVSVDLLAGTRPAISELGWAPISASRLTVACSRFGSGGLPLGSVVSDSQALMLARPHDHCTV